MDQDRLSLVAELEAALSKAGDAHDVALMLADQFAEQALTRSLWPTLEHDDLKDMGVSKLGHRKALLGYFSSCPLAPKVAGLVAPAYSSSSSSASSSSSSSSLYDSPQTVNRPEYPTFGQQSAHHTIAAPSGIVMQSTTNGEPELDSNRIRRYALGSALLSGAACVLVVMFGDPLKNVAAWVGAVFLGAVAISSIQCVCCPDQMCRQCFCMECAPEALQCRK